ncbi:MAG: M66 family metalloprotease [Gemmatimonadota bacterium]|nr:M66 family metalloprotease [Gemmatimonadota bacterium]
MKHISLCLAALLIFGCGDLALEHEQVATEVEILPRGGLIKEDETLQLELAVRDQNGEEMPIPSWAPVEWGVSEASVVELDHKGLLSPLQGGETAVHVSLGELVDVVRFRINPSQVVLSAPVIYLNQAAQNLDGSVELIPGRPALIRVFVVGDQTSYYGPGARVTLFDGGTEVFSQVLAPTSDRTPNEVIESQLDGSVNGIIPGSYIQPGVSMVVELDPEGLVPLAPGSQTRYPAEGSMKLDVVEPPLFRQIIVPTISELSPNESVYNWTNGLNPESRQVRLARTLMPVASMELEVRETYRTGADLSTQGGWNQWINETRTLYFQEGRRGYYYGVVTVSSPAYGGLGFVGFPVSVGLAYDDIYAHELGHNMNLWHAPCGTSGDPAYPYQSGNIGIWGFDVEREVLKDRTALKDVMSYCNPVWISDYHFTRSTLHRLEGDGGVELEGPSAASGGRERGEMLVVWGTVSDGEVKLDPSFVLAGPPALPETEGPYRIDGLAGDGSTEFSLAFAPTPLEYGGGGFVFFVPWDADWADSLDRIVLSGPEGEDTLKRDGTPAMAVVTDPSTGRIQAMIRSWDGGPLPGEGTATVTITRGIPGGER